MLSDHNLLVCRCRMKLKNYHTSSQKTSRKHNIEMLKGEETRNTRKDEGTEAAERFETWGAHPTQSQAHTPSLLVFSKMSFALFVCTNKLLCDVKTILLHGVLKVGF